MNAKMETIMYTLIEKTMTRRLMARRERQVMTRGTCHASNFFLPGISLFDIYREISLFDRYIEKSDGKGHLPN